MTDPFAPDSMVWFGVCLAIACRAVARPFLNSLNTLLVEWAEGVVERRAHRRAMEQLKEEASA